MSIFHSKSTAIGVQYTVEFQWLEHLGNHENKFETGVVRVKEC